MSSRPRSTGSPAQPTRPSVARSTGRRWTRTGAAWITGSRRRGSRRGRLPVPDSAGRFKGITVPADAWDRIFGHVGQNALASESISAPHARARDAVGEGDYRGWGAVSVANPNGPSTVYRSMGLPPSARGADLETCPKCGDLSASPPAEVYCVECATEGWEQDAERFRAHRAATEEPSP